MIEPDSPEDWELEQRAFAVANSPIVPEFARDLVKDLWEAYCDMQSVQAIKNH